MILEQETFEKYGYYSSELKYNSGKWIICKCDYCNNRVEKINSNRNFSFEKFNKDCCRKCIKYKNIDIWRLKFGDGYRDNPEYGKGRARIVLDIGQKIYNWEFLGDVVSIPIEGRKAKFKCACGLISLLTISDVYSGKTKSCGCRSSYLTRTKHGETRTALYSTWRGIKSRCDVLNTDKHKGPYKNYNIKMCDNWLEYIHFRDWALQNGYKEGLSIDRINPYLGYEPSNCQWITRTENSKRVTKGRDEIIFSQNKEIEHYKNLLGLNQDFIEYYI